MSNHESVREQYQDPKINLDLLLESNYLKVKNRLDKELLTLFALYTCKFKNKEVAHATKINKISEYSTIF